MTADHVEVAAPKLLVPLKLLLLTVVRTRAFCLLAARERTSREGERRGESTGHAWNIRVNFPVPTSCTLVGVGGASVHVASGVLAGPDHAHAHRCLLLDTAAVVVDVIEGIHSSTRPTDAFLDVAPCQLPRDA